MDFAIFYDLLLLNTLQQVHTPKFRLKISGGGGGGSQKSPA